MNVENGPSLLDNRLKSLATSSSTPSKRARPSSSSSEISPVHKTFSRQNAPSDPSTINRMDTTRSLPPFVISFDSNPDKSAFKLEKEIIAYLKNATKIDTSHINITSRFGYEGRLVVFARDPRSFDILHSCSWPERLDSVCITVKKPQQTPAHQSIVMHDAPLDWNFDEVKEDLQQRLGQNSVKDIVRLYHRSGSPLKSIRIDFANTLIVNNLLVSGFIVVGHGRHPVKEYHLPRRVIICYNCHQHGHLAKDCKNASSCVRCGQQHKGECQAQICCVNCGGAHLPGQSVCIEVQKRRQQQQRYPSYAQITALPPLRLSRSTPPAHPAVDMIRIVENHENLATRIGQIENKLDKLDKLDKIDELTTIIVDINTMVNNVEKRMDKMEQFVEWRTAVTNIVQKSNDNATAAIIDAFNQLSDFLANQYRHINTVKNQIIGIKEQLSQEMDKIDEETPNKIDRMTERFKKRNEERQKSSVTTQ
jgi:hypothetical protein